MTTERRDSIAWIAWDNGPRNLLDVDVVNDLLRHLAAADVDAAVTAIVLAGSAHTFCGGADLPKLKSTGTVEEFAGAVIELLKMVPKLATPVVALARGDALASGFSLALLADVTLAVKGVKLGTVEVAGGSWPMIAQVPVRHLLPSKLALQNITTGLPFTAERLADVGVIAEVVDEEDADDRAHHYALAVSAAGSLAPLGRHMLASLSIVEGYDADLDAALDAFISMLRK